MKPEQVCIALRIHNKTLADKIENNMYFLEDVDIPALTQWNRHQMVLVRCGNGRFVCPVQNVSHFIQIIEESGKEYVRDVSLPA